MSPSVPRTAPAERLAAFRIVLGTFILVYLLIRLPVFLELARRDGPGFDGVGIARWFDGAVPSWVIRSAIAIALASGCAFVVGWRFRITAPAFALCVLLLTSYRSSWGQMLHFENVFTIHVLVIGFTSGAADAWSLDRRGGRTSIREPGPRYGWALQLCAVIVVTTYVIAGIAKLRYGGGEWLVGDTLRNHVAYSAVRLDLLGAQASPVAEWLVPHAWVFPPLAITSVVIELAAPVALLGARLRNVWVAAVWLMHVGIYALMLVGFPYPLFLVAFAPFFHLESIAGRVLEFSRLGERWPRAATLRS